MTLLLTFFKCIGMNDISLELRNFFIENGLTQKQVGDALGVAEQTINGLLNGRRKFGKKTALQWQNKFGLSAAWLLTGNGDMLVSGHKEVKNYDISIGKDARVIQAGGNVTNSQNDGADTEGFKKEIASLNKRIKELEADKKNLQNMVDFLMKNKG